MPKRFLHKRLGVSGKSRGLGLVILLVGIFALLAVFAVLYLYLADAGPRSELAPSADPALEYEEEERAALAPGRPEEPVPPAAPADPLPREERRPAPAEDPYLADSGPASGAIGYGDDGDYEEEPAESEAPPPAVDADSPPQPAVQQWQLGPDSNGDGLMDAEKMLLRLSASQTDYDNDGFDDFSEFSNLYNPAGNGKISAHPGISRYYSASLLYSFLYPNAWQYQAVDGDSSIMLKIENNQFIQVIVTGNSGWLSLEEWYKSEFSQASVRPDRYYYKAGWQGIRSEDGLTVYLQKNGQKSIYAISYNLGIEKTWNYKNIFEFIIKTFEAD